MREQRRCLPACPPAWGPGCPFHLPGYWLGTPPVVLHVCLTRLQTQPFTWLSVPACTLYPANSTIHVAVGPCLPPCARRWMEYPGKSRAVQHPHCGAVQTYRGHTVLSTLIRCGGEGGVPARQLGRCACPAASWLYWRRQPTLPPQLPVPPPPPTHTHAPPPPLVQRLLVPCCHHWPAVHLHRIVRRAGDCVRCVGWPVCGVMGRWDQERDARPCAHVCKGSCVHGASSTSRRSCATAQLTNASPCGDPNADAISARPVAKLGGYHRECVRDCSWHPYLPLIATGGWGGEVVVGTARVHGWRARGRCMAVHGGDPGMQVGVVGLLGLHPHARPTVPCSLIRWRLRPVGARDPWGRRGGGRRGGGGGGAAAAGQRAPGKRRAPPRPAHATGRPVRVVSVPAGIGMCASDDTSPPYLPAFPAPFSCHHPVHLRPGSAHSCPTAATTFCAAPLPAIGQLHQLPAASGSCTLAPAFLLLLCMLCFCACHVSSS